MAPSGWPRLFEAAFKKSQNPMALTDDSRKILEVNGAMAQLMECRPSELIGRHTYDFVEGGALLSREEWHQTIRRGEVTGDAEVKLPSGDTVHVQFGIHPEAMTGKTLVLFVAMSVSRWGKHFRRARTAGPEGTLSRREQEVLGLVAHGATSPEIAAQLHISHNTVRKHVNSAMHKLGARSRAHLVAKALGDGQIAGD